jgi:hypothetical protein
MRRGEWPRNILFEREPRLYHNLYLENTEMSKFIGKVREALASRSEKKRENMVNIFVEFCAVVSSREGKKVKILEMLDKKQLKILHKSLHKLMFYIEDLRYSTRMEQTISGVTAALRKKT